MSFSNNNNDDDNGESDNEMGRAYSTSEEFSKHLDRNNVRSTTNPVEYLEFVAAQEQYAPKNLSLHQDSLPSSSQLQPTKEQFIQIKQAPSSSVHYVISPDDNPQQNLTNTLLNNNKISNSNINNYNPYFPPTEQQMQQMQQFYHNKHTSNSIPLSPLDEVAYNPNQYQFDDTNTNHQQSSQYQQNQESQQQLQQPQLPQLPQLQLQQQPQQPQQMQQLQQFQRHQNNDDDDSDDGDQSQIDHSAVTPSPLSLPGLFLSRNRSRVSTPRIENMPRIPNAYTAQVHQSDSPLRTEFRKSDLDGSDSETSKSNDAKNMLGEILNKDRLPSFKERAVIKDSNESLVKFDFRNANGDPDDPLLNKNAQPKGDQVEERPLPTGLLTGNINNSNNNIDNTFDNTLNITPHQRQHSSIVSPTSITPIIPKPFDIEEKNHDVIKIGPDMEIQIHKPKQGTILMLLSVFVLAAIIFITWKLGDWGVGKAQDVYNVFTNNGFIKIYPSGT